MNKDNFAILADTSNDLVSIIPNVPFVRFERALMMLPQNKFNTRPFRQHQAWQIVVTTKQDIRRDLNDNISCVLTFADFIETIDGWHELNFGASEDADNG